MLVAILFLIIVAAAITYGVRRELNSIQWIWLLVGTCLALAVIWALLIFFVIGPNMRRMIQFQP